MFNPAQKALAWALTAAVAADIYTGVQTVGAGGEDAAGPHAAAVVVAMVLAGAHILMAVVNPVTRPALAGMVLGRVRRSCARHHGGRLLRVVEGIHRPRSGATQADRLASRVVAV